MSTILYLFGGEDKDSGKVHSNRTRNQVYKKSWHVHQRREHICTHVHAWEKDDIRLYYIQYSMQHRIWVFLSKQAEQN